MIETHPDGVGTREERESLREDLLSTHRRSGLWREYLTPEAARRDHRLEPVGSHLLNALTDPDDKEALAVARRHYIETQQRARSNFRVITHGIVRAAAGLVGEKIDSLDTQVHKAAENYNNKVLTYTPRVTLESITRPDFDSIVDEEAKKVAIKDYHRDIRDIEARLLVDEESSLITEAALDNSKHFWNRGINWLRRHSTLRTVAGYGLYAAAGASIVTGAGIVPLSVIVASKVGLSAVGTEGLLRKAQDGLAARAGFGEVTHKDTSKAKNDEERVKLGRHNFIQDEKYMANLAKLEAKEEAKLRKKLEKDHMPAQLIEETVIRSQFSRLAEQRSYAMENRITQGKTQATPAELILQKKFQMSLYDLLINRVREGAVNADVTAEQLTEELKKNYLLQEAQKARISEADKARRRGLLRWAVTVPVAVALSAPIINKAELALNIPQVEVPFSSQVNELGSTVGRFWKTLPFEGWWHQLPWGHQHFDTQTFSFDNPDNYMEDVVLKGKHITRGSQLISNHDVSSATGWAQARVAEINGGPTVTEFTHNGQFDSVGYANAVNDFNKNRHLLGEVAAMKDKVIELNPDSNIKGTDLLVHGRKLTEFTNQGWLDYFKENPSLYYPVHRN